MVRLILQGKGTNNIQHLQEKIKEKASAIVIFFLLNNKKYDCDTTTIKVIPQSYFFKQLLLY